MKHIDVEFPCDVVYVDLRYTLLSLGHFWMVCLSGVRFLVEAQLVRFLFIYMMYLHHIHNTPGCAKHLCVSVHLPSQGYMAVPDSKIKQSREMGSAINWCYDGALFHDCNVHTQTRA